jgi:hypothetical protein
MMFKFHTVVKTESAVAVACSDLLGRSIYWLPWHHKPIQQPTNRQTYDEQELKRKPQPSLQRDKKAGCQRIDYESRQ